MAADVGHCGVIRIGKKLNKPPSATSINMVPEVKEAIDVANAMAQKARLADLERRIQVLEKCVQVLEGEAREEQIKRNKLVLRELVKDARSKILEANGLPRPKSWRYCLDNLTPQQLKHANVNAKLWPKMKEVLCLSSVKLNSWVYGYSPWDTAQVIKGMDAQIQSAWAELFKLVHKGKPVERFFKEIESSVVDEFAEVG